MFSKRSVSHNFDGKSKNQNSGNSYSTVDHHSTGDEISSQESKYDFFLLTICIGNFLLLQVNSQGANTFLKFKKDFVRLRSLKLLPTFMQKKAYRFLCACQTVICVIIFRDA